MDISTLSSEERLQLIEELWESLAQTPDAIPLTNAHRAEHGENECRKDSIADTFDLD
jgi:putative addiction module component